MSEPPDPSKSVRVRAEEAFFRFLSAEGGASREPDLFLQELQAELHEEFGRILEDYRFLREAFQDSKSLPHGTRLGDFELLRELGRGGMGVVWEAQQLSLERRVALKVFTPAGGSAALDLRRILREAQAAGRIRHPGIVPVFGVGEHEGTHFIVQELVPGGRTLADRISELRDAVSLPEDHYQSTAELFASVAEALAAAHAEGVLHRDLKPANILLDPDGRPRVSDFGIARIQGADLLTTTGELNGTPSYMSPERVFPRGTPADERSDVFSLGVSLYEALTLTRPFLGDTSQEILHKILHVEPPDPRVLRSRVPRDLAVICLKALEKSPRRRYASMRELAADLRHYLSHEPIQARPPGRFTRAWKWAQRHPVSSVSGSVAAVLFVVIAALFVRAISAERDAREEALRANAEARTATRVKDLLVGLFRASDPEQTGGLRRTTEEILAEGVERVRSELGEEPLVRGDLLYELGRVHSGMGKYPEAASFLEEALQVLTAELGANDPKTLAARAELASVLGLGFSRFDESIAELERVLAQYEAQGLEEDADFLAARASLGWSLKRKAEFDRAEPILRGVLEEKARRYGERDRRTLTARSVYADLLIDLKRYDDAEAALRSLLADVGIGALNEDRVLLTLSLHNLARTLFLRSRVREAQEIVDQALDLSREVFGSDHPQTLVILGTRANGLTMSGDWQQAARDYEEVLEKGPSVWGDTHESLRVAHTNLAITCNYLKRMEDMLAHQEAALELAQRIYAEPTNRYRLRAMTDLAAGLMECGRPEEARPLFEEALELLGHLGTADELTLQTRINYAQFLSKIGDDTGALEIMLPTLESCRAHLPEGHQLTLHLAFNLGTLYLERDDHERAEPLLNLALRGRREHYAQVPGAGHESVYQLTQIYLHQRRFDEAARFLREEFDREVPADSAASGVFKMLVARLGEVEVLRGDLDAGEEQYRRLLRIGRSQGARGREAVAKAHNRLGRIQLARDNPMAAEDSFRAALEAEPGNPEYVRDLESLIGEALSEPVEASAQAGADR